MSQTLNRRQMLHQTAAGLASFFCVGKLQFDIEAVCGQVDLHLAAATSFEFMIQKLFIPYGAVDGPFEISADVRAKALEVSRWLNPSNAPQIFAEAQLLPRPTGFGVRFSDAVSVWLSKRSIAQLRRFLEKHPRAPFDASHFTDPQVVECIVRSFSFKENWKYD